MSGNQEFYESERFVLRDGVPLEEVDALSRGLHLQLLDQVPPDPEQNTPHQIIWGIEDYQRTYLCYEADINIGHSCVFVKSTNAEAIRFVIDAILGNLAIWDRQGMFDSVAAASSVNERGRAVLRVGFAAPPEFDEEYFTVLTNALRDPAAEIRTTALWALMYAPWTDYLPMLTSMSESDPSSRIREQAQTMRRALEMNAAAGQ
jgi:hypothetical protein